jgi:hypothetical protein
VTDLASTAGRIAGFLALASFVPYVVDTLRGHARPSRATWWIWTLVGGVLFASHRESGGGESGWAPLAFVVGPFVIALLSVRYGEGGWARLDLVCIVGALLGLAGWGLTGSPAVALALNLVVDALGAVPTLEKAWRDPRSESLASWALGSAGTALNLVAVPEWSLAVAAFPVYLAVLSGTMTLLVSRGRLRAR